MTFDRSLMLRVALVGTVMLVGMALSYRRWIGPVDSRYAETVRRMDAVRERLQIADREMRGIKERQQQGSGIRKDLSSHHDELPNDPVIVWFPSRVKTLLGRLGVSEVNVRLNKTTPEPLLLGFEQTYWLASVPVQGEARKFTDVLLAVAQIEQQDSFVKIEGLSFHLETQEPCGTTGYVNLKAFLPK